MTFKIGMVLKGLDGVLEVAAGGILLLFLSPHAIEHIAFPPPIVPVLTDFAMAPIRSRSRHRVLDDEIIRT